MGLSIMEEDMRQVQSERTGSVTKGAYEEGLNVLSGIKLSGQPSGEKERILEDLKTLGLRFVDAIVSFAREPSRQRGFQIYNTSRQITEAIERARSLDPREAAFTNQAPLPANHHDIRPYKTPYVGAPMNDLFSTFAMSPAFEKYRDFLPNYELNQGKNHGRDQGKDTP